VVRIDHLSSTNTFPSWVGLVYVGGAIAIIIGGVVVFGSNSSTSKQTTAAMKAAVTERAKLIDMIDLRAVGVSRGGGLQHVD
jgi:hypothetical protein